MVIDKQLCVVVRLDLECVAAGLAESENSRPADAKVIAHRGAVERLMPRPGAKIDRCIHTFDRWRAVGRQRRKFLAGEFLIHLEVLANESAGHETFVIHHAHRLHDHVRQRGIIQSDDFAEELRGVAQGKIKIRFTCGEEQVCPPRAKFACCDAQGHRLSRCIERDAVTPFDVRVDGLGEVRALLDFHVGLVHRLAFGISKCAGEHCGQVEFGGRRRHVGHRGGGAVAQFAGQIVRREVRGIRAIEVPQAGEPLFAPCEPCEHVRANLLLAARRHPYADFVHLTLKILVAAPV